MWLGSRGSPFPHFLPALLFLVVWSFDTRAEGQGRSSAKVPLHWRQLCSSVLGPKGDGEVCRLTRVQAGVQGTQSWWPHCLWFPPWAPPSNFGVVGRRRVLRATGFRQRLFPTGGWGWAEGEVWPILDDVNFDICPCACLLGVVDASLVAVTSNNLFLFCFLYKNNNLTFWC